MMCIGVRKRPYNDRATKAIHDDSEAIATMTPLRVSQGRGGIQAHVTSAKKDNRMVMKVKNVTAQ